MKLCDTCIYRNNTEYEKPCIVYRDDCEFYEREGDMTREEAIELLKEKLQTSIDNKEDFADIDGIEKYNKSLAMAIKALEQEPKTGHWIEKDGFDGDVYYDCSECGESWATIEGTPWDNEWYYCPNCGARMTESEG